MSSIPADNVTITHWYKQSVYDPNDNKIGEIEDVLVDRSGGGLKDRIEIDKFIHFDVALLNNRVVITEETILPQRSPPAEKVFAR
jgi:hypothetical protein